MNRKKDTAYGIKRLESKNARSAIIQKISSDFNLMPLVAEAYYKQISSYFAEHADVQLTSGQICYEAVAAEEPAGKPHRFSEKSFLSPLPTYRRCCPYSHLRGCCHPD